MSELKPPDTQGRRYQVFVQEKPGAAYADAGSVHAPDAELALMNARDVFVRRPQVHSLWIVRTDAIFARTAEQLAAADLAVPPRDAPNEIYHVFCKQRPAGTHIHLGTIEAGSPPAALAAALERYGPQAGAQPAFSWWVFPQRLVVASDPQQAGSLFEPALDKGFRMSTDFHTHTAMRRIQKERE